MSAEILLGPILGYENGGIYTVFVLMDKAAPTLAWHVGGVVVSMVEIAKLHSGFAYKGEYKPDSASTSGWVNYGIVAGDRPVAAKTGSSWKFWIPAGEPKIAFTSCSGFSSLKLKKSTERPYILWERIRDQHVVDPYSLLLMGGDQVYADGIWEENGPMELSDWSELDADQRKACAATPRMKKQIEIFYEDLYINRWNKPAMAAAFASIPSVMMWDDHDIFDGWGSYSEAEQGYKVFKAVFAGARRAFEVFQLRGRALNKNLLPGQTACSLRFSFGAYYILALDNRSDRTQTVVMSEDHWKAVKDELNGSKFSRLLVMSGVPVVYRSFVGIEKAMGITGDVGGMEDDVLDHWMAIGHQKERGKLISVLLDAVDRNKCECAAILSGDVHVGGVGVIKDVVRKLEIFQIISTGVVHPPPSFLEWLGIKALTSDEPESLWNGDVTVRMLSADGAGEIIRDRNFAHLHCGTDNKFWFNWECARRDPGDGPCFAIRRALR